MSLKPFVWLFGALLLLALGLATYLITHGDKTSGSEPNATHPMVTIAQGKLQGYTMLTSENRTVYAFVGVPYAQPPVGDLRFMPPVAPNPWNGILNASRGNSVCIQRDRGDESVIGEEDCLYLAIYTPKLPSKKDPTLLPVMFFVIGGEFKAQVISPNQYGPDFLLNEDVILVVPTLRVGVLGFLSTGDDVLPGNQGIKDIVRALKWTQENIKYFSGDPGRVTLFGGSSGAMSISLLTLTDATKGLYHRIITQSGVALSPILQETKASYANKAIKIGQYLGCSTNTSTLLVHCLRGLNGSQLLDTDSVFYVWEDWLNHVWHPTVEPDVEGALITEKVAALVAGGRSHDLPWLNSNVRDEGLVAVVGECLLHHETTSKHFLITFFADLFLNSTLFEEFLEHIDVALPEVVEYSRLVSNVTGFTKALKAYYFPDLTADRTLLLNNVAELWADFTLMYPSYDMLQQRLASGKSPVYYCSFEYQGVSSHSYKSDDNFTGVLHGDENLYLFRDHNHLHGPSWNRYSEADLTMVKQMVKMWTSSAINGEPTDGTILWEPYSSRQNYLHIGSNGLTVKYGLRKERMEFWNDLLAAIPWN